MAHRALAYVVVVALASALLAPLASAQTVGTATANLRDARNQIVASADLRESQNEVLITLTFPRGSPLTGTHAIHVHERGRCTAPDFTDAGGIFNPLGKEHGLRNVNGPMVGDLPDLVLGPTGLVRYSVSAPLATLRPGPTSLLGSGGTALVITSGIDDNQSQPSGNSGTRVACGVILGPGQADSASGGPSSPLSPALVGIVGVLLVLAGLAVRWRRGTMV